MLKHHDASPLPRGAFPENKLSRLMIIAKSNAPGGRDFGRTSRVGVNTPEACERKTIILAAEH